MLQLVVITLEICNHLVELLRKRGNLVVADHFGKAFNNRRQIRDPQALAAWLIQTTRRKAIKMQQQGRRRSSTESRVEPHQSDRLPDEEVQRLERQAALEHALSMMDRRCQVMLRALFFSDKHQSYKDIAQKLGISVNAMGRARERCLSRLRKILDKIGFEQH